MAITNLDLLRSPSKNAVTRSLMSSPLALVNVYSSPLMVVIVKLWPDSRPDLAYRSVTYNGLLYYTVNTPATRDISDLREGAL